MMYPDWIGAVDDVPVLPAPPGSCVLASWNSVEHPLYRSSSQVVALSQLQLSYHGLTGLLCYILAAEPFVQAPITQHIVDLSRKLLHMPQLAWEFSVAGVCAVQTSIFDLEQL